MDTPHTYSLERQIGEKVWAFVPFFNLGGPAWLTVRGVEAGGVWFESDKLTIGKLGGDEKWDDEAKPIAFVPYAQILYVATFAYKNAHGARIVPFGTKSATPPIDE